jgi:outer membrane murein-binding lipoprotein Lpp
MAIPAQTRRMIRALCIAVLLGNAVAAVAADDFKVSQLEQDVRDLQRQVQALASQIEAQRSAPAASAGVEASGRVRNLPGAAATPTWVDAAKWLRIQPGMGELEVLGILGPPTSMRPQQGDRVLFYALEIGASGFLVGSVTLRDRSVASVQRPTLQ